jgi:hypothetical protein
MHGECRLATVAKVIAMASPHDWAVEPQERKSGAGFGPTPLSSCSG